MNHPTRQVRRRGITLAFVSAAGFSTLSLFAKLLYSAGYSVPQTLAWRFTLASAFLLIAAGFRRRRRKAKAGAVALAAQTAADRATVAARFARFLGIADKPLLPLALLGFFGFAPQAGLFFLTVRLLDPGITSLLLYLYPSFVVVFSLLFLAKKPVKIQIVALILSFSGCVMTFFRSGQYPLVGLALGAFVAVAYAAYLVAGEKVLAGIDPVGATTVIMLVAASVYWAIVFLSGAPVRGPDSLVTLAGFIGVSLAATVLPITTLFMSMERIGAADASLVSTVEPVFTVILSAILFGELLGAAQLAGGTLILAAVIILHFAVPAAKDSGGAAVIL